MTRLYSLPEEGPEMSFSRGSDIPQIGIVCHEGTIAKAFVDIVERSGGEPRVVPTQKACSAGALAHFNGLIVAHKDTLSLVKTAVVSDMPVLCIGDGMNILNLALGGGPSSEVNGHRYEGAEEADQSSYHRIFISPGSKLAAIVGSGGFVRVNSRHRIGVREAQKSQALLASAYSLEDGVIEALESTEHRWVIGVQFHPERRREIPPHFDRLFQSLVERARSHINS